MTAQCRADERNEQRPLDFLEAGPDDYQNANEADEDADLRLMPTVSPSRTTDRATTRSGADEPSA